MLLLAPAELEGLWAVAADVHSAAVVPTLLLLCPFAADAG